jgi:hypothetical protein
VVRAKHDINGWNSMDDILRDINALSFFLVFPGTRNVMRLAAKSWRRRKRQEHQAYLVSIVLAIESLGCDLAGWGSEFPLARQNANRILDEYFIANKQRFLDIYMPLRHQMDQNQINETLGPKHVLSSETLGRGGGRYS